MGQGDEQQIQVSFRMGEAIRVQAPPRSCTVLYHRVSMQTTTRHGLELTRRSQKGSVFGIK